jgi:predicted PurR-regulated permease PerM
MESHRESDDSPLRPVTRAHSPDPASRHVPARAGPTARGAGDTGGSARSALLRVAVVVLVLVWVLRDLVLLVGYSVLLAYALLPVVAAIERPLGRRGPQLPRGVAAAVVMFGLVTLVAWLLVLAVPRLAAQAAGFASGVPGALARLIDGVRMYGAANGQSAWLDPAIEGVRANVSGLLQTLVGTVAGWTGRWLSGLGQVLGLVLLPLLAFYLLAESKAVQASALRFLPKDSHSEILRVGAAVDRALRSYVRGQAIVCLVMGIVTGASLALLGSPMALLLGLLVGFAEMVPYVGFLVAATAIAFAGLTMSPGHALLGVAVYAVLNWAIGTFVTPRVMGRYLRMHPFIVTVSVLAGAQVFGPAGAVLALPGAAMLQAVIGELAIPAVSRIGVTVPLPLDAQP